MKTAQVVLILLSNESVTREWINFEAGVGDGAGACVIPVAIDGYSFNQLDFPLKGFQGRDVEDIGGIVSDIERETGLIPAPIKVQDYLVDVGAATEGVLRRGITLEPFVEGRGGANPLLRFRISNTGRRDVELLEVEAAVPRVIINPPNWAPGSYPVIRREYKTLDGVEYLVLIESAYGGQLDPVRYGGGGCLPPLFAPGMTPRVLTYLKLPLYADFRNHRSAKIFYRAVAKGLNLQELTMNVTDIPDADR